MGTNDTGLILKVPVYRTIITSESMEELFPNNTSSVHSLIDFMKKKIDFFNLNNVPIEKRNQSKIKLKEVNTIEYFDFGSPHEPFLLLKIHAFDKNFHDGEFWKEEKSFSLDPKSRIGTENNFVLIYPSIKGIDVKELERSFLIFIYEDPNKEHDDIVKVTKMVFETIVGQPIVNIKPPQVLEELSHQNAPHLELTFFEYASNLEDELEELKEYKIGAGQLKKVQKQKYIDIPYQKIIAAIESIKKKIKPRTKYSLKIIKGKAEYNLEYYKEDAKKAISETAEKLFNFPIEITKEDFDSKKIFEHEFIIEKLMPVVKNYHESYS